MSVRKRDKREPKARFQVLASAKFVDWRLYLQIALAWPMSLVPLVGQGRGVQLEAGGHLLVSFSAAHGVLVLFLWLGKISWWRLSLVKKRPGLVIWMVFFGTTISSIIGQWVLTSFGYSEPFAVELLLIRFTLVVMIMLGYANLERYRAQLRDLNLRQQQLADLIVQTQETISAELSDAKRRLEEVSSDLRSFGHKNVTILSSKLLAFSESLIRPWSHELRTGARKIDVSAPIRIAPNWQVVFERLFSTSLIKPFLTALAVTLLSISFTVRDAEEVTQAQTESNQSGVQLTFVADSFIRSLFELGSTFLGTLISALLVRQLFKSRALGATFKSQVLRQLVALVLLPVLTVISTASLFSLFGLRFTGIESFLELLVLGLSVFPIALSVGVVRTVREARVSVLEETKAAKQRLEWEAARAHQKLWQLRKSISNALHGPIRASLLAAYFKISKEPERAPAIITELLPRLEEHIQAIGTPVENGDPLKLMWQTLELWRDVCEMSFDASEELLEILGADPIASVMLSEIVNESVSNAIKHGNAKTVRVELKQYSNALAVTVVNDGDFVPGAVPGLGSRIMDESALSWSLKREAEFTILKATIPLSST